MIVSSKFLGNNFSNETHSYDYLKEHFNERAYLHIISKNS